MSPVHKFRLSGKWEGEGTGLVQAENVHAPLAFSAPVEFRGQPGFWTPEHLLLGAISSCFLTTTQAIAANSKFRFLSLEAAVEGEVSREPDGWQFTAIRLTAHATIAEERDRERAIRLMEKAERACIVSRALIVKPQLTCSVEVQEETEATPREAASQLEVASSSRNRDDSVA